MANNLLTCPRCAGFCTLKPAGERVGGFSAGKAAVGGILLGPIGLAAGALGKKKTLYVCEKCGYSVER